VVTEFRKKLPNQPSPIVAKVVFFCSEYCINQVTKWLSHWYTLKKKEQNDEDEIDDEDRTRKDAALECLSALFGCRVSGSLEDFLSTATSDKDPKVLGKLKSWTHQILEMFIKDGETSMQFESTTHPDMREKLRPFRGTAQNAKYDGKPLRFSPWPFVEVIRYHLENAILEQGNCIADVPGANDINAYRITIANEYLQSCDMTMVVGDIKRVLSDASFRQHYINGHHRRYHGSLILCATRSDDQNDDGGSSLQLDPEAESQLAPIEEQIESIKSELKDIGDQIDRNRAAIKRSRQSDERESPDDEIIEPNTAARTPEELKEENKALKARQKEISGLLPALEKQRWDARNAFRTRHCTRCMDEKYRADTGDDGGAVCFGISNRMFMRHVRGYNLKNPDKCPSMSLEATQIPALCSYIYGLPSQGKTAALEHFVRSKIHTYLDLIQMSCSKSTEARVNHVIKIIDHAITVCRLVYSSGNFTDVRSNWSLRSIL